MKYRASGKRRGTNLPLPLQVEAELNRYGFSLAFPPELEKRYRTDTAVERTWELKIISYIGALLYFSCGLLLQMVVAATPSWHEAAIQMVGAMAAVMLISRRFFSVKVADAVRETAMLVCCLACALAAILVVYVRPVPATTQDFVLAALPVNFVLMFVRLRFPAAAGFVIVTFGVYVATVVLRHDIDGRDAVFQIGFMATLCLPALIGVHAFERASRRIYLHSLQQSLRNEYLAAENTALADLSQTDPLTQVANRRRLDAELKTFCETQDQRGALLLIDVDRFKAFNDQHGHLAGDACLRQVAQCLASHLRRCDLLARFGGEEFAVLLPDMTPSEAAYAAERLRGAVQGLAVVFDGVALRVTVSIGVAACFARMTPEALIGAADAALYAAKRGGRNRITTADLVKAA